MCLFLFLFILFSIHGNPALGPRGSEASDAVTTDQTTSPRATARSCVILVVLRW